MSEVGVIKVDRHNGIVVSVTQMIGNIRIEWRRGKDRKLVERRGKPDARVYDPAQLEIPPELYNVAVRQAYAILFPKPKQSKISISPQLSLL